MGCIVYINDRHALVIKLLILIKMFLTFLIIEKLEKLPLAMDVQANGTSIKHKVIKGRLLLVSSTPVTWYFILVYYTLPAVTVDSLFHSQSGSFCPVKVDPTFFNKISSWYHKYGGPGSVQC